jgi:hypothetical protein
MSDTLPRQTAKQRARTNAKTAKALAAKQRAEQQEQKAEAIAPAAQRLGVRTLSKDGKSIEVYAHPRLDRDGVTFKRSTRLPALSKAHEASVTRLIRSWEDGGESVTAAISSYGERVGSASATPGYMSDQLRSRIGYQNRQRTEFEGAAAWMGALFPVVKFVILEGINIKVWAEQKNQNESVAKGYLIAALDRLTEFYAAIKKRDEVKRLEIRAVQL